MSKYLLEIGTEELPYRFIPMALEQLKTGFENFFQANSVEFGSVEVFATPRRLAVIVKNLAEKQPDVEKTVKGPIKKVAYDEAGNLTQAGKGFLAKNGLEEKDAYIEDDYLHAKVFVKGKATAELLQENVPQLVLKLQGPYFMRWAANDEKFSRPIRWIVSILGDKELPVQIVETKSSKFTRGHRFTQNVDVEINNVDEYVEKLKKAHVIVNQDERKALIVDLAKKEADKLGATLNEDCTGSCYYNDLLEEVTYLCEYPVPCVCDFDKKYLDIPEMVSVTVMASHQRYFALYKDGKLLNKFITITNFLGNDFDNIKAGNERVVTARLEDAIFFFKEDTKKPLIDYVENLKGITFQKGLGSVYDKTQRIIKLSKIIADKVGCSSPQQTSISRTALLCKADLATKLVFEFPELQGYIGATYAGKKQSGRCEEIGAVHGILEHYYPLSADGVLAEGIEGQIVGIADKLDTICAVFAGGKIPTGSSDPLGVRRAALGIIKTILQTKPEVEQQSRLGLPTQQRQTNAALFENFNLSDLIKKSVELIGKDVDVKQIEDFFVQRLIIFLSDSFRKDVLEACVRNKNPLEDLCDYVERVELLTWLIEKTVFMLVLESANRIQRIVKDDVDVKIQVELLRIDAEKELYEKIKTINVDNYTELVDSLIAINPAIEKFFEDVLVMDNDEKIKQNRLAMLTMLKKYYNMIADFSALQM